MMKLAIYKTNGQITNIHRVPKEYENDDLPALIAKFNTENAYRNLSGAVVTVQDGSVIDYLTPTKRSKEKSEFLESVGREIDILRSRLKDIQDDAEALDGALDDLGDLITEGFGNDQ